MSSIEQRSLRKMNSSLKKYRPLKTKLKIPSRDLVSWVRRVEELISMFTTAPRTKGKYKGHGDTDTIWVVLLYTEIEQAIKRHHGRSMAYDGNMAIASQAGLVLATWHALVRRAKTYDENRPAPLRRKVLKSVIDYRALLCRAMNDDLLMGKVWKAQRFNPPIGKGVKSGKFV